MSPEIGFPAPNASDEKFKRRPVLSACFWKQPFDEDVEGLSHCYAGICDSIFEFNDRAGCFTIPYEWTQFVSRSGDPRFESRPLLQRAVEILEVGSNHLIVRLAEPELAVDTQTS